MHAAFQVAVRLRAVTGVCNVILRSWWDLDSCFHSISSSVGEKGEWGAGSIQVARKLDS